MNSDRTVLFWKAIKKRMDAWEFCRRWFDVDVDGEQERGYRAKCVKLLAQVIGLEVNTVERWGSNFERMPDQYRSTLSYADTLRQIIQAASGQRALLDAVLDRLKDT